ncbi:MAG: hypothetical protein M1818_007408 [Claussenomyces sp. TS43310]|nr:MAG: hypothetical protein M1818_007408 [Claussenomyces sp. TS43310]
MASKKIIVVFGATGGQGGSVVKSLLDDPQAASQFAIRAVTRDSSKAAAKALEAKGCELVTADLNDRESLKNALKGAYGVFAVTNYWEKLDGELEYKQGCNVADEVGVKHLIWMSNGKLKQVYHFDSKAKVQDYIKSSGLPATYFLAGMFMSNLPQLIRKNPGQDVYSIAMPVPPATTMPLLDTEEDTGKFVKAILLKPKQTLGKEIYGATDYYSVNDMINTFKEVKPVDAKGATATEIPHQTYKDILASKGMPAFVQEELLENFLLNAEPGYYGGQSLKESHAILDEPLTTLKEYLAKNKTFADLK